MTDEQIKKSLECCSDELHCCSVCPCYLQEQNNDYCREDLNKNALDLINRLQAENERLSQFGSILLRNGSELFEEIQTAKAEAYKECIEKVKKEINEALINNYKVRSERAQSIPIYTEDEFWNYCAGKIDCLRGLDDFLNNLLKELVGEE